VSAFWCTTATVGALEHGGGTRKMGGGSGSRSRKKMAKAVSWKYAFIAGTRVPSGARVY
jgi:hypothetical protein